MDHTSHRVQVAHGLPSLSHVPEEGRGRAHELPATQDGQGSPGAHDASPAIITRHRMFGLKLAISQAAIATSRTKVTMRVMSARA